MRNWMMCVALAMLPAALAAQAVDYQLQLAPGEVVVNVTASGNYIQRGTVAQLRGQLAAEAASVLDADLANKQNFDLLVNSLTMLGVNPSQIRQTKVTPATTTAAGQARSVWYIDIELYDLSRLAEVTSAMEGADVRSIQPAVYDVRDRSVLLVAARQRAIDNARREADAYATALGLAVRRVTRVGEKTASVEAAGARSELGNEGDVVATVKVDIDVLLGPMFTPPAVPVSVPEPAITAGTP
jgi:uncharacterized protein YggE